MIRVIDKIKKTFLIHQSSRAISIALKAIRNEQFTFYALCARVKYSAKLLEWRGICLF